MSSEQQSCLRFSVEESVWFQKGQEVRELISISLDPEIQIYEQDQYVSIRGALYLTGEYYSETEADDDENETFAQARYVEGVVEREDGTFELEHRFPVDITIPRNRIQNLDDVYVAVDSFDYSTPARGCLQLDAELSISGIYGQQQTVPPVEEKEEEPQQFHRDGQEEEEEYDPFKYYLEDRAEEEVQVTNETAYDTTDFQEEAVVSEQTTEQDQDEDDDVYEPFQVEVRKDPTLEEEPVEEVVEQEAEAEEERDEEEESSYTENVVQSPVVALQASSAEEPKDENKNIVSFFAKKEEREDVEEKAPVAKFDGKQEEDEEKVRDENNLSLTKIFAEEDGSDFTRLKICIVQHGETIDSIAERYDVTIQQLIRMNGLASDADVSEGQLIYVPAAAYSNS
ncbi:stage VI sporulation protein D [Sutcliffiella cohnii]|uniref:Stage VI sporulation protein D n=1 Tax=Sutcliffiella cohnii TaxID=33932 RepID=A0A223KTH6_9BACI|nr:stage VI sporulation protein D [Sutcliffiella cohnii]AST92756.1 stage VI sporulation protein D [Sutcliffiella cohnii]MED4016338.1 stage VI sporulation protein D [Sutcliffiella cohnii]